MPVKLMSVQEWIDVPDNPIQRNTERHAAKAKHLRDPKPTHWVVFACQYPDKKLVKLDGHTRALLWKRKEIPEPRNGHVECHLIPVKNDEEAMDLYRTFDSKEALETVTDKVSGGFHHLNFSPESALLQRGAIASALKVCWNVWKGRGPGSDVKVFLGEEKKDFSIYEAMDQFSPELFALDSFALDHKGVAAGVVAAFILTHRKYCERVVPFWLAVFGNAGEKSGGKMDGVQAVAELVLARKGRYHGHTTILDLTARCVMACEKWLADEMMVKAPPPFDLRGYIAGIKPVIRLIKTEKPDKKAAKGVEKGAAA